MKAKILLFVCLIAGIAILLPGCSEDNSQFPDLNQNNEVSNALKSKKIPTQFSGTCTPRSEDLTIWYDATDDERVTGISRWNTTEVNQIDDINFELAGTAEIFVGANTIEDVNNGEYLGKWDMTWKGSQTLTSPDGSTFRIVGQGVGAGTEGTVFGLTARWKYTMVFDGSPESLMYISKGKITEEL
ncbi:hypothetical protein [Maribellus sediminis]|uniref:hypothetical protein n=1 Tax=Maribellus sediminis TaxID=2696285 RepID=UPI00142FF2EE|nr:hypothetical protein [Maribellus sediminis]